MVKKLRTVKKNKIKGAVKNELLKISWGWWKTSENYKKSMTRRQRFYK